MKLFALCAVALATSCYRPSFQPCELACAAGEVCPDGLACNEDGLCTTSASASCKDALDDARVTDAIDPPDGMPNGLVFDPNIIGSCGWPQLSNIDACAVGAGDTLAVVTVVGAAKIDTSATTVTFGGITLPVESVMQRNGDAAALVRFGSLTISSGALLTITGAKPLILTVNTTVEMAAGATILVANRTPSSCETAVNGETGAVMGDGGGGGGGGGFGGEGGAAGLSSATDPFRSEGGAAGSPGHREGNRFNVPLRSGCAGGTGAATLSMPAGAPSERGRGGGALQISARDSMTIAGTISASGGGGGGAPNNTVNGGGGGGSGGVILLESPTNNFAMATLCAEGGGGGGSANGSGIGGNGGDGACTISGGAVGVSEDAAGGAGGAADEGKPGATSTGNPGGGGGGGGGVGRIRLNGTTKTIPSTSFPAYTHD